MSSLWILQSFRAVTSDDLTRPIDANPDAGRAGHPGIR
jgi:hypothetical protein